MHKSNILSQDFFLVFCHKHNIQNQIKTWNIPGLFCAWRLLLV